MRLANNKKNNVVVILLSLGLIIHLAGYARSDMDSKNEVSSQQQIEYNLDTYYFTNTGFQESELRTQIQQLPGVVAVQVNVGDSTIVVKYDKNKNSKGKLKKSFEKMGLLGYFIGERKKKV